jgi:proteasome lid subunit RPN8/RPN11
MQLWLRPELVRLIIEHARNEQPNECCGLILGHEMSAQQIVPIPNVAEHPEYEYHMDDQTLVKAAFQAQHQELEIIGFYHSHPRTDPILSQTDIQLATYPDTAYVIASLKNGEGRLAAWSIQRDRVAPITIIVSAEKPAPEAPQLTIIQKRAIIASAIIAFIFMLILSLSLLPPAPVIPVH